MKLRLLTILALLFSICAYAQQAKLGTVYAQITAASRTAITTDDDDELLYSIKATWKGNSRPESIYFRADDMWANCIVKRSGKEISPEQIRKGNKLEFKPVPGGRFPIPKEIENIKTPALFFTIKGKWYYLPVKNIKKKNVARR
ncbi:MAG TPA: hypothetical protein VEB40_04765 [Flavipsychrobacter sp.]|nr:hypothetical protein [Flavipsychrobacter sp.]